MSLLVTDRTTARARRPLAALAALTALAVTLAVATSTREAEGATAPNVIFILTDDQTASELAVMPNTNALLAGQGVTFRRAYSSYPLCCPARATLLSGQYMHNHGVRGNLGIYGGWGRFIPHEANALPVRTDDKGYYNVHIGKYMNAYTTDGVPPLPVPLGWDEWYGKISEDSLYFNYSLIEKTGPSDAPSIEHYGGQVSDYQTDALREKATDFLSHLTPGQQPFMMNLWFNAPHAPFEPAPRHLFTRSPINLPRPPGYNEKDISDKPKWLRKQARHRLNRGVKRLIADERKRREEQLLSVDEAVGTIVSNLAAEGLLDETYIVYASDNGFFRGEHRIAGGKYLPHEPSSRVPLLIRGPGIPAGTSDELVTLGDIPQTILDVAGDPDPARDGRSLLPFARDPALRSSRPILLEADTGLGRTGAGDPASTSRARSVAKAGLTGRRGVKNLDQEKSPVASVALANGNFAPPYKAIRTDRYLYVLYGNGQSELYDMKRDPAQLRSLAADPRYRRVRKFLFNSLIPLSTCAGASCRVPIGVEPLPLRGPRPKPKGKEKKGKPKS